MAAGDIDQVAYARDDFRFFTPLVTRWGDCDMMGHINNVILIRYLESGRLDYLHELLGMDMQASSREGIIIADLKVSFLGQVHHPSQIEVATRISSIGNSSLIFDSAIFPAAAVQQPALCARATLVWFDYQKNSSLRVPQQARETIHQFEGLQS